ncbi:MAG: hypothetical protein NTW62_01195 [Candidatus Nomurabacteria bacterium]|nr:hypothetical protein [Candidatus Nomurabacteria bacterium]
MKSDSSKVSNTYIEEKPLDGDSAFWQRYEEVNENCKNRSKEKAKKEIEKVQRRHELDYRMEEEF